MAASRLIGGLGSTRLELAEEEKVAAGPTIRWERAEVWSAAPLTIISDLVAAGNRTASPWANILVDNLAATGDRHITAILVIA